MSITVEAYSEKAIVVRNTLEHHGPIFQALGGTFNERLKGGRGWIFPKHMMTQVKHSCEKLNSGQFGNEYEQKSSSTSSNSSSDGVSKQEYLSLLSRVERLEALISNMSPMEHTPAISVTAVTPKINTPMPKIHSMEEMEEPFEKKRLVVIKK
jgi:hypothetical protein